MQDNEVVLSFTRHSTHRLQPSDVSVCLSFKFLVTKSSREKSYHLWCSLLGLSAALGVWVYVLYRRFDVHESPRRLHEIHSPRKHQDLYLTIFVLPEIINKTFLHSVTSNITSRVMATGISPFNPDALTDDIAVPFSQKGHVQTSAKRICRKWTQLRESSTCLHRATWIPTVELKSL